MSFETADLDIFLSDFADEFTIQAVTWGKNLPGIFAEDYTDMEEFSRKQPYLIIKTSDIPTTATDGDLFIVTPACGTATTYKLVDMQYSEPGLSRAVLAIV